uniref:Uncharacterized protein n=1 Tax=Rhizophora mucronata TaxID=61149 RepID=A0A2P2IM99_RHIMU
MSHAWTLNLEMYFLMFSSTIHLMCLSHLYSSICHVCHCFPYTSS